eukprot:766412-Hanusia_phi.AAC.1
MGAKIQSRSRKQRKRSSSCSSCPPARRRTGATTRRGSGERPWRTVRAKKEISAKWLERSSPTVQPGDERMFQNPRRARAHDKDRVRTGTNMLVLMSKTGSSLRTAPTAWSCPPRSDQASSANLSPS